MRPTVGDKEKNKHEHKRTPGSQGGAGKVAVMGVMERGGELRARKMERLTGESMKAEIKANVKPGAVVLTDEAKGYIGLQGTYDHYAVNHSAGEYVRLYFIHTNGLETLGRCLGGRFTASTTGSARSTLTATWTSSPSTTTAARLARANA